MRFTALILGKIVVDVEGTFEEVNPVACRVSEMLPEIPVTLQLDEVHEQRMRNLESWQKEINESVELEKKRIDDLARQTDNELRAVKEIIWKQANRSSEAQ